MKERLLLDISGKTSLCLASETLSSVSHQLNSLACYFSAGQLILRQCTHNTMHTEDLKEHQGRMFVAVVQTFFYVPL